MLAMPTEKNYNTEIISVGTELLLGHVTNTDSRDISEMLSKIGINVKYHTVVGDNPQRLRDCVDIAKTRADIIITTGGLGPTCDDLTKQILAEAFGVKLVMNEAERSLMYDYIWKGRVPTENNLRQFMLPEGCTIFHNDWGTAPGCAFESEGKIVVMVPGPPKECRAMFSHCAVPYLQKLSDEVIVSHCVNVFGISESKIDDIFASEMDAMINPTMAPYAKECDCLIQVTAKAGTCEEGEKMLEPLIAHIRETVGECAYGIDVESMEEALIELLKEKPLSFSIAEGFTGGEVANRFAILPESDKFLKGGVVCYSADTLTSLLGIDSDVVLTEGEVSLEIATEMAETIRQLTRSDIGFGVVGTYEDIYEIESGTVFVAMATENETFIKEINTGTHRTNSFIRRMAGNHVFDMMRRFLSGISVI